MPQCYSSCDYFRPRPDYKCRRFENGVSLLDPTALTLAPIKVRFGRWARLMAYGPRPLVSLEAARSAERSALRTAALIERIPGSRGMAAPVRRKLNNRLAQTSSSDRVALERLAFVLETFVEGEAVDLLLSARLVDENDVGHGETYRSRVTADAGHQIFRVPLRDLLGDLQPEQRFCIELAPADEDARPEIAFGLMDVVEFDDDGPPASKANQAGPLKCVVWDLDNTLWEGTLIEDGADGLRVAPEVRRLIEALDQRGVLQSLASKNNPAEALEMVASLGLAEYFLVPQVSWAPKSEAIGRIANRLNIGTNSLAFIDDQPFERAEVEAVHPDVLVLTPEDLGGLLAHPRLQYEVTDESRQRRAMYRAELDREQAFSSSATDYDGFLRSCRIEVQISRLGEADVRRAHELAQRTNQLNLSGTRYTRDQIESFGAPDSPLEAFTVRADDRFGSYGMVGFCVYQPDSGTILDMMFSCRIQSKLVDDVFLAWLAERHSASRDEPLRARFTPLDRNSPARQLIERAGFQHQSTAEGHQIWARTGAHRSFEELAGIVSVLAPDRP